MDAKPGGEDEEVWLIDASDVKVRVAEGVSSRAKKDSVSVSKAMSLLLRHRGPEEGLVFTADGWVDVEHLLKNRRMKGVGMAQLVELVRDSDKQRFAFGENKAGKVFLRANQGHSFKVNIMHEPVVSASQLPNGVAIHGTYHSAWTLIKSSGGLNRMSRLHIHFAVGLPREQGVISGMRASAQVLIYLDVDKCISNGIPLFLSNNGVVLSPGDEKGTIPCEFFLKVLDAKTGEKLM